MNRLRNNINVEVSRGKINNVYYPHFTAYYNGGQAKFALDLTMTEGKLPASKVTHQIMDWAKQNYILLERKWNYMISDRNYNTITTKR